MTVRRDIEDFICRELLFDDRERLPGPDEPLLGSGGVVDSVGLHQLIEFIESHFQVKVGDLEIVPENFDTLNAVTALVERKQASGQTETA